MDNRLTFMDQTVFDLLRATGTGKLLQFVWIYDHPVDFDEVRRFHRDFGYGMAGRLIERSTLPFGRHRWVSSLGPSSELHFEECARPRDEVTDWADERAELPVDPEKGPGWHMGVLPLTDGSTAITLLGSHCIGDGAAALLTTVEAVLGNRRDIGYPLPRSRKRFRDTLTDLRQTAKDIPEAVRALGAAVKLGYAHRHDLSSGGPKPSTVGHANDNSTVVLPSTSVFVDLADWDARASALNGNSYSLLAGFAAKLAERMGRARSDRSTTLLMALNDRSSFDDTRANVMLFPQLSLDPAQVTEDLTNARNEIRKALKTAREVPDEMLQLIPLIPFVPRRALKGVVEQFLGGGEDLPSSCSNLGDIPAEIGRPDGTDAEYVMFRGVDQNVRRADVERAGGQLVLVAGRINGKMSITVVAYQRGSVDSKPALRELATQALSDFDLTGEIL
ncbi:hypothetical protein [Mycobacterium sp. URHB0021]|jgi:hypothetical protein